ncbi:GAF domain-containing protein [Phormidium tenue FACHB-886]|nr:GAF domain-containing protein [Phormidium tenue FACHB-886]
MSQPTEPPMSQSDRSWQATQARLAALEQENALLQLRLQSYEQAQADLQPNIGRFALEHCLLEATAEVANALLTIANFDKAVNTALQIIGEALETDRVVVIESFDAPSEQPCYWRILYEWHSPMASQLPHSEATQGRWEDIKEWYEQFVQGQSISCLLEEMPELLRLDLEKAGVKATHIVPIFVRGKWWGTLGLNDYRQVKRRSAAELSVLKTAADCIGSAIQRERIRQALAEEAKQAAVAKLNEVIAREKAAQDLAAEQAKANATLRRSLSWLAHKGDLNQFLKRILLEIAAITQVDFALLFVLQKPERMLKLTARVTDGAISDRPAPNEPALFLAPFPADITPIFRYIEEQDLFLTLDMVMLQPELLEMVSPDAIDWLLRKGPKQMACLVLKAGDRSVGALCLGFREAREFSQEERELVIALANQSSLAILSIQLAEEAKQVAIAREQERTALEQVAELAKANKALRESINALTAQPSAEAFLGISLRSIATVLKVPSACLWRYQGEWKYLQWVYQDGEVVPAGQTNHPNATQPTYLDSGFYNLKGQPRTRPYYCSPDDPSARLTVEQRALLQQLGVRCLLIAPIVIDNRVVGEVSIRIPRNMPDPAPIQIELVITLVNQVALALELTRLAEEAKQAAIAREQERAAQQQAAELSRANILLRNSLSRLSTNPNLQDVLGHLLIELVRYTGASVGHIFTYDSTQSTLTLSVRCQGEEAFWTPAADEPALLQSPIPVELTTIFTVLCAKPRLAILNPHQFEGRLWQGVSEWFQAKGYQGTCSCVLMVGERPLGMLAMAFPQPIAFLSVEEELILALAQQIALVIQLTALGEADKQTAIAREQEQAAHERAAKLAKANDALRHSVAHLTSTDSLTSFPIAALQGAIQACDAASGYIFVYQPDRHTFQMTALVLHGEIIDVATDPRAEAWRPPIPAELTPGWQSIQNQQIYWTNLEQLSLEGWSFVVTWQQQQGHETIPMIPLTIGEQLLGFMGLAFTANQPPSEFLFEQCRTFAHHAALALRMAELVQQTKQTALLEERNRMAREIHDTLAQSFTSIGMQLEAATRFLTRKPTQAQACLSFAQELARDGLAAARRSVWALQSEAEDYRHLASSLQRLAAQRSAESSVQIEVSIAGTPRVLPADVGMNLLRIGQEALNNAMRHAQAQIILLTLTYAPDHIQLQIQDDGQGFDPQLQRNSGGFGLMGMQQRSDRLGATMAIASQLGQGTEVRVTVPLQQNS